MASITIDIPVGRLTVLARDTTVLAAGFTEDVEELRRLVHPALRTPADADLDMIAKAVNAYCEGDLTAVNAVAVEQRGGPFLEAGWAALRSVPPGQPISYTELAARAGRPAAVRAAAQACARNAAALFVPCHRVVRTDGTTGGYRYGIEVKRWLLAHEREIA